MTDSRRSVMMTLAVLLSCAALGVEAQPSCNAADSKALLDFKADFIDSTGIFTSWRPRTNCCTWTGVNCTAYGRVQGLTITAGRNPNTNSPNPNRNPAYPVGTSLGSLSALDQFYSSAISFQGPIPSAWIGLKGITALSLTKTAFTGSIPSFLQQLTRLSVLQLDGPGNLTGPIPPALCNLRSLQSLSFVQNTLTGSPPPCLTSLKLLQNLNFGSNVLSGPIPRWLGALTSLTILDLSSNRFSGPIPSSIGAASKLLVLLLNDNKLSGPIPWEIGRLTQLSQLSAANNMISGRLPTTIGNLKSLSFCALSNNQISGLLPKQIGDMSSLGILFLDNNRLSGPVPPELGNIPATNRVFVQLDFNYLSGRLPNTLANLGTFTARNNRISGGFPLTLATQAFNVDLSNNQLTVANAVGTTPNNPQLNFLSLQNNRVRGPIPTWLSSISSLYSVDLSGNFFSGPIPVPLLTLSALKYLNISSNPLNTGLPSGPFTSGLLSLDLHTDGLTGRVPRGFVSFFPSIQLLDLSGNRFNGPVPHVP